MRERSGTGMKQRRSGYRGWEVTVGEEMEQFRLEGVERVGCG